LSFLLRWCGFASVGCVVAAMSTLFCQFVIDDVERSEWRSFGVARLQNRKDIDFICGNLGDLHPFPQSPADLETPP
jgi:hypothetical protein